MGSRALDGAWWPYSRNLGEELGHLVEGFPADVARVLRVVYSRPDWDDAPRRVATRAGYVKAGSFPRDDSHELRVRTWDGRIVTLVVVPFDLDEAEAAEVMDGASTDSDARDGTGLLAAVHARLEPPARA